MKKKKKIIYNLLLTICLLIFAYSGYRLISYYFEYKQMNEVYTNISNEVVQDFTFTIDSDDILSQAPTVDMEALANINREVVGYILIPDTRISYPILYSSDELKYLNYNIYNKRSRSGSIFLEPYDEPTFEDSSIIIHGHNMIDDSMFGQLNEYIEDEEFFKNHPYIYVYTRDTIYLYRIFSSATVDVSSSAYRFKFLNQEALMEFIDRRIEQSSFTPEIVPESTSSIITLSTCGAGYDDARTIVQAYLVDKKAR